MVRFDLHAVLNLDNRQGGVALQQFHQDALAARIEMLDDDKAKPGLFGDMTEELIQCLQSTGGSPNTDNGKGSACRAHGFCEWSCCDLTGSSGTLWLLTDMWS